MADRKYPIDGDAGVAWFLVFDPKTGQWIVEEVRVGAPRQSLALAAFETTEIGRRLAQRLSAAIERAAQDA